MAEIETEIELKYLVDAESIVEQITAIFSELAIEYSHSEKSLSNTYFDTQELGLRKMDMGLRVRTYPDGREQTIKTRGKVIAGLHQRPEFNVAIDTPEPDLTLFPQDVWSKNCQLEQLTRDIVPIFSTDFIRNIWLVNYENSQVEVCFDQGVIDSNGLKEPIRELELELKSGSRDVLFLLAKELFAHIAMRPGKISKAARGYALWQKLPVEDKVSERRLLNPVNNEQNVAQVFYSGVEFGLGQIQDHIAGYIAEPDIEDLFAIRDAMQMLSYGMKLYKEVIASERIEQIQQQLNILIFQLSWLDKSKHIKELTTKSGAYRKKLEYSKQLLELLKLKRESFPTEEHILQLIQGCEFNQLQSDLLQLLLDGRSVADLPELSEFSYQVLESNLQQLIGISSSDEMTIAEYLALKPHLETSLLSGSWFGALYNEQERQEYRGPWLDILHGIDELSIFALLQKQLQQLEEQPAKVIAWLDTKIENLLHAIEHSRKTAIEITPYWRIT